MKDMTEYLKVMFIELERLCPTTSATSHGIAWDKEKQRLLVLFNTGDSVFPYVLQPGEIADDPVLTAEILAVRCVAAMRKPENEHNRISFKR